MAVRIPRDLQLNEYNGIGRTVVDSNKSHVYYNIRAYLVNNSLPSWFAAKLSTAGSRLILRTNCSSRRKVLEPSTF